MPINSPLRHTAALSAQSLADIPFILPERSKNPILRYLEEQNVDPDIRIASKDDCTVLRMVERDIGISILNRTALADSPADIIARPLEPPLQRDIVFAVRDMTDITPLTKRFIEYLNFINI